MQISSTSSSTSTSSLGDTTMKGFGGLVSGLDRDSLIDQLTSASQAKVTKAKQETTTLEWKQEAYQNISDKVIDLEDKFLSYTSTSNVKNSTLYAETVLTAQGDSDSTKFVKASGLSDLTKNIHIAAVKNLATTATIVSGSKGATTISTNISVDGSFKSSKLSGARIAVGTVAAESSTSSSSKFTGWGSFTMPTEYTTTENGQSVTKQIDYTTSDVSELVKELNAANISFTDSNDSNKKVYVGFEADSGNHLTMKFYTDQNKTTESSKTYYLQGQTSSGTVDSGILSSFGVDTANAPANAVTLSDLNAASAKSDFTSASVSNTSIASYLSEHALSISYSGTTKSVSLLSVADAQALNSTSYSSPADKQTDMLQRIQARLNSAFGDSKVVAGFDTNGKLQFANAAGDSATISVTSSDIEVRSNLGIAENASNKVTTSATISAMAEKLGLVDGNGQALSDSDITTTLQNMQINGVNVGKDLTASSKVSDLLNAINKSSAGVKASYMTGSGRFVLISSETGSGRTISLNSEASAIFGGTGSVSKDGTDAELVYNYGNGVNETLSSSSNSFNIDGLTVTVNGTFGYDSSTGAIDTSKEVTFSASADVDAVKDKVKSFIDAYNEIVKAVNDQITTRPDSSYEPLTEEQEDKMTEKQVDKWNEKAKAGILNGETVLTSMSTDLQSVMTKMVSSLNSMGLSYDDLKNMGISMSDNYYDGGTITFDEEKFKTAMTNNPDKVSKAMTGDGTNSGLTNIIETTLTSYATRYATRNGGSYGSLIEEAGSSKITLSKNNNAIYRALKVNSDKIDQLKKLLSTEKERYSSQFTQLEELISEMNSQSSTLSSFLS